MKERVHLGRWKSVQAEQRFRALEDQLWHELWPEPPESLDIDTHLGPTRVYRWPGEGDPVVFLHGMGATSLMWSGYIGLLEGRTVYAVDTIGDVGRSQQQVPVSDTADLAAWLDAVLAGARIDHAHLVGASYGGFLALNQAVLRPARVRSIALVEPVGLVPLRFGRFMLWGGAVLAASTLPAPMRRAAGHALHMPLLDDKRVMRMVLQGYLTHRPHVLPPGPLTDEQLRSVAVPVLLLLGEKSQVHRSCEVLARATELLPDVDAEIVPGAGHPVPMSHTEHIAGRLNGFLLRHDTTNTTP
jgi:pimeloyl-ACP methyl ester carboxylesterase